MITGIFFWAERVGVQNIRLDIVNTRLQLGSNAIRIRDIAEHLRLKGAADVDIANFQYSVNQSHPHVDALDIRIVNVGNIDADQSAADGSAFLRSNYLLTRYSLHGPPLSTHWSARSRAGQDGTRKRRRER